MRTATGRTITITAVALAVGALAAPAAPAQDMTSSGFGLEVSFEGSGVPGGSFTFEGAPIATAPAEGGTDTQVLGGVDMGPAGRVGALASEATFDPETGASTATAGTTDGRLFPGTPAEAGIGQVSATCVADEGGVAGSTSIVDGMVAGMMAPTDPEPNTMVEIPNPNGGPPLGVLTLNEQIMNDDGSLTVIGAHYVVDIPNPPPAPGRFVRGEIMHGVVTCMPVAER